MNKLRRGTYLSLQRKLIAKDQIIEAPRSMYIHVPFCKQRCHYCDFPIQPLGKNYRDARSSKKIEEYIDSLLIEIQYGGAGGFNVSIPSAPLDTIYIGGGTPSILPAAQIQRILDALHKRHGIAPDAEISMELDPGTFDAAAAAAFRAAGVNRASIGVQSLDDALLRACGRGHTAEEAVAAVRAAQAGGFEEVSVDMMSGLPGDTLPAFEASLRRVARRPAASPAPGSTPQHSALDHPRAALSRSPPARRRSSSACWLRPRGAEHGRGLRGDRAVTG